MSNGEEQFRILFEQATDGIFIADAAGNYLDANPAGCRMLGYTRKQMLKLNIADVIAEEETPRLAPEFETGRKEGSIKNHWKFKRKDNTIFIGEVSGTVLSDGRLQATVRNMTEYMRAREVPGKSEEASRITLDYMLEGCQIIGHDWRYLYLNRSAESHNRRPNTELLGNRFMDMWPGIDKTEVFERLQKTLVARIPQHFEFRYYFPDGYIGWYDLSFHPVSEGAFILSIDITERKNAEYALRESEEKYRLVSENADDWIYWVNPQGIFRYISPACEVITGYEPQAFMENPSLFMEIVWPEDREKVLKHIMLPAEEQVVPHSLKFRIFTKKGALCWIDHSCKPIFSDGSYKGQIGTNRDITEIKVAEEKLYESELKFRKIFEEGPFGMALTNREFRPLMVNTQLCRMLGIREDEVQLNTFRDLTSPEEMRTDILQISRLNSREISVYKTEKRYIRKDGQVIWGSLTVTANFNDKDEFLYNVVIIEDITRRKQAEEELVKATERLRLATSVAKVGIWDWNLQNNNLFWDDKMYEIYGIQREEFPGVYDGWISRVHPEDVEYSHNMTDQVLRGERDYKLEFRVIWKDQSVHWISSEGQVFRDEKNSPVRMIGVNYDITSRKVAEQELQASKRKLETAIDSMTDAVFITDRSGAFVQFNEAFATFHKYSSKEECGNILGVYSELFEIYSTNDTMIPPDQWAMPRALRGETARNEECIMRRKDTGDSWMASFSFAPIRDPQGEISGVVISGRDITESKQAEEALRISEERYRNIFESSVIGIYRTTPEGKIIMANPTLIHMLGFDTFEELAQRNLEHEGFDDQKKRQEFREIIEKQGSVIGLESEWKTRDGQSVFVSENAKVFFDSIGKPLYYEGTIEDITERRFMERNLRESEEKFRKAFLTNLDAITITSFETGKYNLVNKGYTQIFGYTEAEVMGKSAMDLDIWTNSDDWSRFLGELNKKGSVENFEATLTTKGGRKIETLVSSVIIEIDGQKQILSTTKDITELKRAQEAAIRQESLLNEMGRIAQIGGWEYFPHNGQVTWTREVANIHDLDPTTNVTLQIGLSYYAGESAPIIEKALQEAVESERAFDLELELISAKGIHKWVRVKGNPLIEQGKVIKLTGSFQDITNRKKAEDALRRSEENFRLLMESISLPVAYIGHQGNIIFRNTKFIQLFGYSPEEIPTVDEWWVRAFPNPGYRHRVVQNWELFVNQAKETRRDTTSEEYSITCKDGSERIIITSGVLINSNILITLIDITDRKRAEEEVRKLNATLERRVEERTFQLLEANRELEAFSYSVSHDLRAPLRHINGFVDLLNQKYHDLLPDKGQHYLKTIVDSTNHMGTLIDDLLQFSRTGRQEMQQRQLDMNLVVQDVMKLLDPDLLERAFEWKTGHLPVVKGDQALLGMVWYNLLSNAVKFTKNMAVAEIEIGCTEDEKEFIFFVRDNGAGFDMKYVHKLFGVFQRLHSRQDFEGTGIGLANVRRIVQKHGGRTWGESVEEQGATFYFTLPKN